MSAQGSLGRYQFGKYLFTEEHEAEDNWYDENDEPVPGTSTTRYGMFRGPNERERGLYGDDWASAYDVGKMEITHTPPVEELPKRRVVGNAAAKQERLENPRAIGAEGTGRVVHSRGFHERYSPTDTVDFLLVDRGSRTMVPTMLGMAQRAARENTGRDLQASTSLSSHSQKLVDKLKGAGLVPQSHEHSANRLTFLPPMPVGTPGGLEGFFSKLMRDRAIDPDLPEPIPVPEVEAGRQEGREIVRRARPWKDKSS